MKDYMVEYGMKKKHKYIYDNDFDIVELLDDAEGMFTTQLDYPYAQPTNLSDENDYEIQQESNGLQPKDLRPNATDRYIKRIGKSRKLLREY
tara:strand:+ start:62 stop:337 length:276 start_codon:yes stop_codon:yes gene_type:complete